MQFKIETLGVYGQVASIVASGNPFRTELEVKPSGLLDYASDKFIKDLERAKKLASCKTGEGHDNFLRGILVEFNVTAPLYWWKQAQRYTWFNFISSQSTMHCLLKFNIKDQCVEETDTRVIEILESLVKEYNELPKDNPDKKIKWRTIVASLPCGFCLGATMTTNYQQLKTMYFQRKNHKLSEWHTFCEWCESLPYFKTLILGE